MGRPRHSSQQVTRLLSALAADPARWRYGYELSTDADITAGTMYPALARLADDGLLEHRWELPSENGRPRHLYRLTATGLEFATARVTVKRAPTRTGGPLRGDRPSLGPPATPPS